MSPVSFLLACLFVSCQTSVFESCRIESQSNNEIPFLLYIPSIVKLLKARHQRTGHGERHSRALLFADAWLSLLLSVGVLPRVVRRLPPWCFV